MASNIFVQNVSPPTITITQINFGGNPTSCDTLCPCAPADYCSFTIGSTGTANLDVYVSNGILNGCITVTDSLGYIQNQNIGGGYLGIATFTNVTYDGITDIQIEINDNFCAPIPTLTATPNVTPNVTPTQTVTPPLPYSLQIEYAFNDGCDTAGCIFGFYTSEDACAATGLTLTIYSTASTISDGVQLWFDNGGTSPFYTNYDPSPEYLYWNGNVFTCSGGTAENSISCLSITPTQTETQTPTPTQTPTNTETQTQTPTPSITIGASPTQTETQTPTPTQTPTNTETQTQTPTPSVTIGITPTQTQTQTPTNTETPTQTQTPTNTETPTQTQTSTNTETPTQTQTPTNTKTPTQTQTPTQTYTQTQTPTGDAVVQFQDCSNGSNIFRFGGTSLPTTIGDVYYITGSTDFEGCATIVSTDNTGPIYDAVGVTFTNVATCIDSLCPRTSIRAALLTKCSNGDVIYANVNEDTAFVGAAYIYNGECYAFVEFSGPGGPDFGDPDFGSCISCVPSPTPTNTPNPTPTNSPTISATPAPCSDTTFCLRTTLTGLLSYNGNYTLTGTYNTRPYYVGDGSTVGYIYHTGSFWCLSNSLGGSCLLQGSVPCYSNCPDISANYFAGGVCPTPTPTPINCNGFDFNAYFDCDWEPVPTPTPSVPCEDVNFDYDFVGITPTPTPTIDCVVGLSFSLSGYTPAVTPTITVTPSITLTRTVDVAGQATFGIFDETFSCVSVKVLQDCSTGMELYTTDSLIYDGIPVVTGITIFATISGVLSCATYLRDDTNFSSNSTIDEIFDIYADCEYCTIVPTPTPTITSTPTQTQTPTTSTTPSQTPTNTITPSPSATVGTTPPVTPSQTQTQTPSNSPTTSMTPTPSVTPNYVYVFQSCSPISPNSLPTQVIQTQPIGFSAVVGSIFKDSINNCWTYNGRFDSTYIAPTTVISITYSGDFFASSPNTTYPSCQDCQTIPPQPLCTYIYFNAYRCDTGEAVVVYACDFTDPNNQVKLDYRVGETHAVGDRGSEFCVSLDSIATNASTGYLINTPPYAGPYNCFTCPLYKTYYVNSCDGTTQNLLVYASSTSTTLLHGTVIKTDISADCYTVVSYEGLVSNPFFLYGFTPQINQIFGMGECETCLSLN